MKRLGYVALALSVIGIAIVALGYRNATSDPVVRMATVPVSNWPEDTAPVRAVLISDLHVAGPDMPPARLARIVSQINALKPDIVLIAGDMVSDKAFATRRYSAAEAVDPLKSLKAPLGIVAVLGNHDHWRNSEAFHRAVPEAGVTLLVNNAIRRGPLVIGGVDDSFTGHADVTRTTAAMDALAGIPIILSHSPDIVPALTRPVSVVLAGHTHCGQISLPLIGRFATASRYGERFACGLIVDHGQRVIVSAGLGTSILPLRYGVRPDLWLITIGPDAR
ncbi:metallophosphoesterase [Sphingomonas cavernae]|uniref:Phosphohydrolase n=1 Tax=Sphingomonas cavernae TaxID=2320861 RepID=A0A418WS71_9SPHN|nr:metallophosphoesterase [Sphingomonas cavernae]RJF94081.1 phosphohydrolase [Sphingomonas cavernae]